MATLGSCSSLTGRMTGLARSHRDRASSVVVAPTHLRQWMLLPPTASTAHWLHVRLEVLAALTAALAQQLWSSVAGFHRDQMTGLALAGPVAAAVRTVVPVGSCRFQVGQRDRSEGLEHRTAGPIGADDHLLATHVHRQLFLPLVADVCSPAVWTGLAEIFGSTQRFEHDLEVPVVLLALGTPPNLDVLVAADVEDGDVASCLEVATARMRTEVLVPPAVREIRDVYPLGRADARRLPDAGAPALLVLHDAEPLLLADVLSHAA